MYSCTGAGGGQLPSHPLQLGECFTSWLEKLSSNLDDPREKAIIIIDNADLILVWPSNKPQLISALSFFQLLLPSVCKVFPKAHLTAIIYLFD